MLRIYDEYKLHGIDKYYLENSDKYYNPHQEKIEAIFIKYIMNHTSRNETILDIACGDGLISRLVHHHINNYNIDGCDPYFDNQYVSLKLSFEDIALGQLKKRYDLAFCCYAFHLIKDEWKYDFLTNLAYNVSRFIIITPSKKIIINHPFWTILEYIREDKITIIMLKNSLTLELN
jgi:2-polyprenyl-3-methyl-5-hydroxy-6-metoxy-1,4-benzoquinol methylase